MSRLAHLGRGGVARGVVGVGSARRAERRAVCSWGRGGRRDVCRLVPGNLGLAEARNIRYIIKPHVLRLFSTAQMIT
jgi:hypothetical protein